MEGIVSGFLGVVLALFFLRTVAMASRDREPTSVDGTQEIVYSIGFKIFCGGLFVLTLVASYGIYGALAGKTILEQIFFVLFIVTSWIFWYWLTKEAFVVKVQFDRSGFSRMGPKSDRQMEWNQVQKVSYNHNWQSYVIGDGDSTIRVCQYMSGLISFLKTMNEEVSSHALVDIQNDIDIFLSE